MSTSRRRAPLARVWRPLAGLVLALLFGLPILYTVLSAFKTSAAASAPNPTFLPTEWSLENFAGLNSGGSTLGDFALNSVIVTLLTVVITTVVAVPAGYALSKFRFPFQGAFFALTIAVLLVPGQAIMTGIFSVMITIHLTNSFLGLALIYSTAQLPFAVFMIRNSFDSIPKEIGEAAEVDGCTKLTMLPRLYLRLIVPGIVTIALFAFLAAWNEFFAALVLLNNNASFTLPIALVNAQTGPLNTIDWGGLQAGITVTMLPCVLLFAILQRYYVAGLISGAVN